MQDRYAGDVGDFMKLSLLKTLAGDDFCLGVNWYRVEDETHNKDGRHITYLRGGNRIGQHLRHLDPDLYESLGPFGSPDAERNIKLLEERSTLKMDTAFYGASINHGAAEREGWHENALKVLARSDVVFVDPDNGLRQVQGGANPEKYAFGDEVRDYFSRGQSLVLYHHADRSGTVDEQVQRRLDDFSEAIHYRAMGAVIACRGTVRFFLVAAQRAHANELRQRLLLYGNRTWGASRQTQHARVVWGNP